MSNYINESSFNKVDQLAVIVLKDVEKKQINLRNLILSTYHDHL